MVSPYGGSEKHGLPLCAILIHAAAGKVFQLPAAPILMKVGAQGQGAQGQGSPESRCLGSLPPGCNILFLINTYYSLLFLKQLVCKGPI